MKPIYKTLELVSATLQVSLALQAKVSDGADESQTQIPAYILDSLRVELVAPNVSGARDLIKSGECTMEDNLLNIILSTDEWIKGGVYRLQVSATFGTQTQVIYSLDVTVPRYDALASEPQEYEEDVIVVSTYGNSDKSGADAVVYAKDGDGNAHITTPLTIGNASGDIIADGIGSIAIGNAGGEGANIQTNSDGSIAIGYAGGEGANIQTYGNGSIASGYASGDYSSIIADGSGSIAIGNAGGEGASIQTNSDGCIAIGNANGFHASIQADGNGSIASGYASEKYGNVEANGIACQAFGIGVKTVQETQMVVGKCNVVDEDNSYQFIVGNGTADNARHNAFAVTKSGELVLFEADGTPVILDAATLKALIASV